MTYDIWAARGPGRWFDEVAVHRSRPRRYNNGTCIAPNTCECAKGWTTADCSVPICEQTCMHNGNCTLPNTCTCEMGWTGHDCSIPICAQDCNNGGRCVAPDTCRCVQFESSWRDGHEIPRPLFRKPNGDPQLTGWTGFDCSVPVCVQAEEFLLTTPFVSEEIMQDEELAYPYQELGGHGYDAALVCDTVRCPKYDDMVVANLGKSFQTGCGYDPLDTGCCIEEETTDDEGIQYKCRKCPAGDVLVEQNLAGEDFKFTCTSADMLTIGVPFEDDGPYAQNEVPDEFFQTSGADYIDYVFICGRTDLQMTYQSNIKASVINRPQYGQQNRRANFTSARFLCGVQEWTQGDYVDNAQLGSVSGTITGVGVEYGASGVMPFFESGRHVRVNHPNISKQGPQEWVYGEVVRGEGIYMCANKGTCIAPDLCTCKDGWAGFDCRTPLCRHLQPSFHISGCENLGVCKGKDDCDCVQTESVLWQEHEEANRGMTGWTGTDCTMPICMQGFFDPFCTDLPAAPGGEGCYRCLNGGNCTAPDHCECAAGWQGYDCSTPVCEVVASPLQRDQLDTDDEETVSLFETDPCTMMEVEGTEEYNGYMAVRGNCTLPNECTCLCKKSYNPYFCANQQKYCKGPFRDPLVRLRNLLGKKQMFGTRDCVDGYEGSVTENPYHGTPRLTTCHMEIFDPVWIERYTTIVVSFASVGFVVVSVAWLVIRKRLKAKYLQAKIERRRSRRSSEESITAQKSAFAH